MDKVNFTVNGDRFTLSGSEVSSSTSLNDYLRQNLGLFGTKAMCHEGGCGACVVAVELTHPHTKEKQVLAVNSCLIHILQCHEWNITTIEGLGNRRDGYSPFQTALARFNGTQCGYCSPGWIMNMYSLYEGSNKQLTEKQIERSFGGNMCRCTGYRPILDAFKTFATNVQSTPHDDLKDLEDLDGIKCARKCMDDRDLDNDWCILNNTKGSLMNIGDGTNRWYKAFSLEEVFTVLKKEDTDDYRFVAGNTGKGVYPITKDARVHIDISSVDSLTGCLKDENLVLGAGMTLRAAMEEFKKRSSTDDFLYLGQFYNHLDLVAHVPVRNVGTIGGNLALKNAHHDFPSDIFLLIESVNGTVTIVDSKLQQSEMTAKDFLKIDLTNKLILNVKLPPLSLNHFVRTFKIMPRAQNAHAIVNAGFMFELNSDKKVISANLVFGSINPNFTHATRTESLLKGRELFSNDTLQLALATLQEELVTEEMPAEPSAYCRKAIALGLFYKAILSLDPPMNPRRKSGGSILERPLSRGTQIFDTDKTLWPLTQPIPKLEALSQCAGEAPYACDVPLPARGVHVALVLSTVCLGEIVSFDASEALRMKGVIAFYTAKDIPGKNSFTPTEVPWQKYEEEIFASETVLYYGQPVGMVAAVTRRLAIAAARLVIVKYNRSPQKPVLTIKDAMEAPDKDKRFKEEVNIEPAERGKEVDHVIKGTFSVPDQYHYTMESQSCSVRPTRRGLAVRAATQWMDIAQVAVAKMLDVPLNSIEVSVPRVGGAYGGKASRAALVACACALAAHKLARPASLVLPLTDNMAAIGKRQECYFVYELGVNNEGAIQYVNLQYYSDCGSCYNDTYAPDIGNAVVNLYASTRFSVKGYSVLTDKACNTWVRAPATTEAAAVLEHIMERIAHVTNKDPLAVRVLNIAPKHAALKDMLDTFKNDSNYDERKSHIAKFNSENAWKKKALKLSLMSYPIIYYGNYSVNISVYHADGTVSMSHGGIEMGQGINTKVAQVCAHALGVPLSMVTVRGSDTFVSPNAMASSGSITSESVAHATLKACNELLERLAPVKSELTNPTWHEVIKSAFNKGIHLQVSSMTSPRSGLVNYTVYGMCAAEVELDVLTGTHQILRVDLLEDTGKSMNPDLDVGQVEGAFVMGLGLWTSERLVYARSGQLLTDRTWTYKPPGALDIPADFRVAFTRNSTNEAGVLRSKATGEPALVLAVVVALALHDTIAEARKEYGYRDDQWLHVDTPYCVDNIITAISPNIKSYKLQ